ncbi:MAG TPA: hypothetical protein VGH19_12010 [Verrucomicrobiae bacterium]
MLTPTCPQCSRVIPAEDINVVKDVAYCRSCNLASDLSVLVHGISEPAVVVDLQNPPKGAWYRREVGLTVIGATHRSWGAAVATLAFGLFWNGVVSVFVMLALLSTLKLLGVPLPSWVPKMDGEQLGWGMTIFLWLFLTPFIVVGLGMIGAFLSSIGGKTEVRVEMSDGLVFVGVGSVGWKKRFNLREVKGVRVINNSWTDSDGDRRKKTGIVIELHDGKEIEFGSVLTKERMMFVAGALRRAVTGG